MAMQEMIVRLSPKMVRELDSLALAKKLGRERLLDRLVKEALRRESARRVIGETMARKQASPQWQAAFQDIQRVRASVPRVPAKELARDIQAALDAVRKSGQ